MKQIIFFWDLKCSVGKHESWVLSGRTLPLQSWYPPVMSSASFLSVDAMPNIPSQLDWGQVNKLELEHFLNHTLLGIVLRIIILVNDRIFTSIMNTDKWNHLIQQNFFISKLIHIIFKTLKNCNDIQSC